MGTACTKCEIGRFKDVVSDVEQCNQCNGERTTIIFGAREERTECKCRDGFYDPGTYTIACEHERRVQAVCRTGALAAGQCTPCPKYAPGTGGGTAQHSHTGSTTVSPGPRNTCPRLPAPVPTPQAAVLHPSTRT